MKCKESENPKKNKPRCKTNSYLRFSYTFTSFSPHTTCKRRTTNSVTPYTYRVLHAPCAKWVSEMTDSIKIVTTPDPSGFSKGRGVRSSVPVHRFLQTLCICHSLVIRNSFDLIKPIRANVNINPN